MGRSDRRDCEGEGSSTAGSGDDGQDASKAVTGDDGQEASKAGSGDGGKDASKAKSEDGDEEASKAGAGDESLPTLPPVITVFQEFNAKAPAFFTCRTGVMLWGQLNTVIEGSQVKDLDTNSQLDGARELTAQGSIIQQGFRFRVAARKGQWKVEQVFQEKDWHTGFVCHHIDVDGVDILRRAARMGTSGEDEEIVSVSRYDWSSAHKPGYGIVYWGLGLDYTKHGEELQHEESFQEAREVDDDERELMDTYDEGYYKSLVSNRFMLLDVEGFMILLEALQSGERLEQKNYLVKDPTWEEDDDEEGEGEACGVHLVVKDCEYELGWMAYSNGELVGFVYDGAYTAMEGSHLRLGDTLVEG